MLGAVEIIRLGRVGAAASNAPMTAETRAPLSSEFFPWTSETGWAAGRPAYFSLPTARRDHNARQGRSKSAGPCRRERRKQQAFSNPKNEPEIGPGPSGSAEGSAVPSSSLALAARGQSYVKDLTLLNTLVCNHFMAMGRRNQRQRQKELWGAAAALAPALAAADRKPPP